MSKIDKFLMVWLCVLAGWMLLSGIAIPFLVAKHTGAASALALALWIVACTFTGYAAARTYHAFRR